MALTHLHLVARPADITVTMTSPTRPFERPLDVGAAILATRRTVEAGAEPDTTKDSAAGDLALIIQSHQRCSSSRRESTVMTERMRRGLIVEISNELKAVLEKARTLAKRTDSWRKPETRLT